jgi:hypothetical protein
MRGILADVNAQGHATYLLRLLEELELLPFLDSLRFATLPDLGLPRDMNDRSLWSFCQTAEWVLLTQNRNQHDPDSLQATIADSWQAGMLPIVTLANGAKFLRSRIYAQRVAADIAELLYGIERGQYRDQPRVFVPL